MPKELRSQLHEGFAGWLERTTGDTDFERDEILGYHLEQAYRFQLELGRSAPERARRTRRRQARGGGDTCARPHRLPAAVSLLQRGSDLLPGDDPRRLEALPDLALALTRRGELERAYQILGSAVEEATRVGNEHAEARARLDLVRLRTRVDPKRRRRGRARSRARDRCGARANRRPSQSRARVHGGRACPASCLAGPARARPTWNAPRRSRGSLATWPSSGRPCDAAAPGRCGARRPPRPESPSATSCSADAANVANKAHALHVRALLLAMQRGRRRRSALGR